MAKLQSFKIEEQQDGTALVHLEVDGQALTVHLTAHVYQEACFEVYRQRGWRLWMDRQLQSQKTKREWQRRKVYGDR